jgi:5-methylthioadenosine/S-adenosylhomocysteine deaminase
MKDTIHHPEKNPLDLAIEGGTLLTMSDSMEIIEDAFIGIRGEDIVLVGRKNSAECSHLFAKETLDASGCLVMPGLINTHTHLPMVCFRGLADDLPLMEWLTNHIWPVEKKFVGRKMVYDGATLAVAEMILSGTTTFCDGYFYEDAVAEAARAAGIRAVVAQGFADFVMPDKAAADRMMKTAKDFVHRWREHAPMITPAYFCHAPYSCSPATLSRVKDEAREEDLLYLIHLLENKDEAEVIFKRHGRKPVDLLRHLGILDEKTIAVHCNWLSQEDIGVLAAAGVKVAHNPESSMKLAAGIAPVPELLRRGVCVGLGTDGCASNNDMDMIREMDTAAKVHKVAAADPTVMSARQVCRMATIEGARVLGLEKITGSIEEGKKADLILIDMHQPHLTPLYNAYSQLVYAARGADVKTSIINGRVVMRNRKPLTLDVQEAMKNVRCVAAAVMNQARS